MLTEKRDYYKPFEYPWAYKFYKDQKKMEWHPEEVPLIDDLKDYNSLHPDEQKLIRQIFRFFTQADCDVSGGYCDHSIPQFKPPEIRMMLTAFASMEGTHIDAYSLLLETLGLPETEYQMFSNIASMAEKHDYLNNFSMTNPHNTAKTLAVYHGFAEGVQLFSSFAILLNFPRFNKMKNMGQIVTWSIRDESLHVEGMTKLFRAFVEEHPEVWSDNLKSEVYSAAERIIELEDAFIDTCFSNVSIEGLTPEDVKGYIRYIAGKRLKALGFKNIFGVEENNLPWIDSMTGGVEHTNFFENRPTEYSKASTIGNWEDIF